MHKNNEDKELQGVHKWVRILATHSTHLRTRTGRKCKTEEKNYYLQCKKDYETLIQQFQNLVENIKYLQNRRFHMARNACKKNGITLHKN